MMDVNIQQILDHNMENPEDQKKWRRKNSHLIQTMETWMEKQTEETTRHTNYLVQEVGMLLGKMESEIKNVHNNVQGLQVGKVIKKPKMPEPVEFTGEKGSIKLTEWITKIEAWLMYEDVTDEKSKLALAISRLSGPATKSAAPWVKMTGQVGPVTVGEYDKFIWELTMIYSQRDTKEGARKEWEDLCNNKELAHKNYIKWAE